MIGVSADKEPSTLPIGVTVAGGTMRSCHMEPSPRSGIIKQIELLPPEEQAEVICFAHELDSNLPEAGRSQ